MKHFLLFLLFTVPIMVSPYAGPNFQENNLSEFQNDKDRELSDQEVKERGIDLLVNGIVESIDAIDLRKMARSSIFETSYGFRWKMVNLSTSQILIVKVDKDFNLISVRDRDKTKII